ncbi:unnamed protein product [Musa acuminata subsp. burmannicoides]
MEVGRQSFLSFNDGRRRNSGWTMYEYEICSSGGFERRVLCHVKRSSHQANSSGTTIKTVDKPPLKAMPGLVAHSHSDVSPPPTAVVQRPLLAPVVTPPKSHLSSVDSVAPNEAGVRLSIVNGCWWKRA